jgi:hypothetical protein
VAASGSSQRKPRGVELGKSLGRCCGFERAFDGLSHPATILERVSQDTCANNKRSDKTTASRPLDQAATRRSSTA